MSDFIQSILSRLSNLGSTPQEVALALREKGMKGRQCSSKYCPIARFLHEECGCNFVAVASGLIGVDDCDFTPPLAVSKFIAYFDCGDYPQLIEEPTCAAAS